jgi:hypothetical protein
MHATSRPKISMGITLKLGKENKIILTSEKSNERRMAKRNQETKEKFERIIIFATKCFRASRVLPGSNNVMKVV